jgi:GNAT superfamily N-acetyltransferase
LSTKAPTGKSSGAFVGRSRCCTSRRYSVEDVAVQIRPARAADSDFLLDMLVTACNWTGETRINRSQIAADPHLSNYVTGWPRLGDYGVVAEDENGTRVGAAWARIFTTDHPGYGFVAEGIPEISMAVLAGHRGRGIGRTLIATLIQQGREAAWPALSLSVEDGNRVASFYRELGFRTVGRCDNSDTMRLDLEV